MLPEDLDVKALKSQT